MGGGWTCINFDDVTDCHPTPGVSLPTWDEHDPSIGTGDELWEVVDDGGVGSPVVTQPVADSPAAPDASPQVTAPGDDPDQDRDNGKKGKKHKKGGKGRKK